MDVGVVPSYTKGQVTTTGTEVLKETTNLTHVFPVTPSKFSESLERTWSKEVRLL